MNNLTPDAIINFLSGIIGGGLVSIPFSAFFSYILKREELSFKSKLDIEAKKKELLLQHKLEMIRISNSNSNIDNLTARVERLEKVVWNK